MGVGSVGRGRAGLAFIEFEFFLLCADHRYVITNKEKYVFSFVEINNIIFKQNIK